nr:alpha-amylase family glycosyl hydrolase [uncultured Catonella sp.]
MKLNKILKPLAVSLPLTLSLTGCNTPLNKRPVKLIEDSYRVAYEIFVSSFYDGNGDGIGDLEGIRKKLDYINDGKAEKGTSLLANEIWLTPISPSLSYHKYDVMDYKNIDKDFGTLEDFKALVDDCHKRNIKVIFDLVMNHSSSEHPWFLEAANYLKGLKGNEKPDFNACPYANYYNFTKEQQEGYAPVEGTDWYYEARFSPKMPDFNLENEAVRNEFKDIFKFWLDIGVDGFRLDAVTYYVTGNITKNTEILTWLNKTVKEIKHDAYIVGEAWSTESEYGAYYTSGVDSFFDFEFSGSDGVIANILKGINPASNFAERMIKADELFSGNNPNYINAPFYTNHDIPRSAGYYSGEHRVDLIKLAGAMNLLMSGNAFIYYGEELGMKGSGRDENKRAPMQWTKDNNAAGMCKGPKDMEEFEMMYGTLEEQADDKNSIYNYYKNAIKLRHVFPVIARGKTKLYEGFENLDSETVSTFTRNMADDSYESVLIVINTSENNISQKLGKDYTKLGSFLVTGEKEVTIKDGILNLPSFSIAILTH